MVSEREREEHTRATTSASTTGMPWDLKRLETVLFPEAIPPVSPTILILSPSCERVSDSSCYIALLGPVF
jgi:hypothetical protein